MEVLKILENAVKNGGTIRDASRSRNLGVMRSLLGPAARGLLFQVAKVRGSTEVPARHDAFFDWQYVRAREDLAKLYTAAKNGQWDASKQLDWSIDVDPYDPGRELMPGDRLPLAQIPAYRSLPPRVQAQHRHHFVAWVLSQFLHGEQGALFAACQVTEAVRWLDGKLYGSTQVVDEGRHVEVFHRYLVEKLEKLYQINDNLYVIIDALMSDSRWDLKFLGMQIMIEGLALGAFGTIRSTTKEPLLQELLKYVITDEARHVHYGVLALRDHFSQLSEKERGEREQWAYEMTVLMRNRFLAHEFYEEYYAHVMTRRSWNQVALDSPFMALFRRTMFRRIIPNLKRIGLLSDRVRPHYAALGLLDFEMGKAAPELTAKELLEEAA